MLPASCTMLLLLLLLLLLVVIGTVAVTTVRSLQG